MEFLDTNFNVVEDSKAVLDDLALAKYGFIVKGINLMRIQQQFGIKTSDKLCLYPCLIKIDDKKIFSKNLAGFWSEVSYPVLNKGFKTKDELNKFFMYLKLTTNVAIEMVTEPSLI